jgi:hypothetical protein
MSGDEIVEYATIRTDDVRAADGQVDWEAYATRLFAIFTTQINAGSTASEIEETFAGTSSVKEMADKYDAIFASGYSQDQNIFGNLNGTHKDVLQANMSGMAYETGQMASGSFSFQSSELVAWNGVDQVVATEAVYSDNLFTSGNADPDDPRVVERLGRTSDYPVTLYDEYLVNEIDGRLIVVGLN